MDEEIIAWDVIPQATNHPWLVDVVHLEESHRSSEVTVSVSIAAGWTDDANGETHRQAWRIVFRGAHAYRMRPYGHSGNLPLTHNVDLARPADTWALWEVFPSQFLEESSAPGGTSQSSGWRVHHYVIWTGGDLVYEFAAREFAVEPLPDSWAHPFSLNPVPAPEL